MIPWQIHHQHPRSTAPGPRSDLPVASVIRHGIVKVAEALDLPVRFSDL